VRLDTLGVIIMASYRYTSFKFDRENIANVDADAKAGLTRFLAAREAEINTISTRSFACTDGPFEGMTVEQDTQAGGFLPLDFKGWVGSYIGDKWHGTTGEPLSKIDQSESAKSKDFELGRGFEQLGDLFAQMSEDPEESSVTVPCRAQITITHNGQDDFGFELASPVRVGIWHTEQHYMGALKKARGRARDVYKYISTPHNQTLTSSAFMDDFGTLHNAPGLAVASSITIPAQKKVITYTIGRTAYTVGATAQAIDQLRSKILAKKRWFADKLLSKKTLSVSDKAAHDVAQVVAGAQAMAAIEQASESSALQELASDTTEATATSTDQAACQADDMQELVIVGEELAQQAGQQEPGASGGNMGHASTTNTSGARQVASGTRGQSINSKSGVWSALFFVSDSGAPSMEFKQNGRVPCIVEFESGSDRMRALQQSAKWADEAAMVCTTPPASQAPEQTGAVPNSETPQDQTPGFERVKPFNCDPAAMLANGIKPEQLVGMGVNYTGNMASPDGDVAGTQGERSANDSTPGDAFDAQAAFEKYGGKGNIDESTDITAKSKAFSDMAESEGYKVAGRGDKYVTITKSFGKNAGGYDIESIINVRISDHSNVNRGRHFGEHDINIAPDDGYDRDTFVSALKKIKSAYVDDDLSTIIPDEPTQPASHAPENTTGEHHENAK
jgi:hypothetical protein